MLWTIVIGFVFCCISFSMGLVLGSALTRNQMLEEMSEKKTGRAKNYFIIFALLVLPLSACLPSAQPEPEVIERKCHFVELRAKPDLPGVEWIQGGDCVYYRCLTQDQYEEQKRRDAMLRAESKYVRENYQSTKERCE